ncbi:hypothetical protein MRX96_027102 [Rhipicephalus microplus]
MPRTNWLASETTPDMSPFPPFTHVLEGSVNDHTVAATATLVGGSAPIRRTSRFAASGPSRPRSAVQPQQSGAPRVKSHRRSKRWANGGKHRGAECSSRSDRPSTRVGAPLRRAIDRSSATEREKKE